MLKKSWDIFIGWCFTPSGLAVWGIVGGVIMSILTHLTTILKDYAPLSYGLSFFIGVIIAIVILRGLLSIWISFSQKLFTKKPTYIEYKINNRRSNLVKKSNIYQEPSFSLIENLTPHDIQIEDLNRNQRRAVKATQPNKQILKKAEYLSARILTLFEKPIASSSMHIKIESISGECPTIEASNNNERWASLHISNIREGCYFRIYFNDTEEVKK